MPGLWAREDGNVLARDTVREIETTVGIAKAHYFPVPRGVPRATLVLGQGADKHGVDSWDLNVLARSLPDIGVAVIQVEQPWVAAGRHASDGMPKLEAAFREVVTDLRRSGEGLRRLVVGGRSHGARVACRTAASVEADAVMCLSFPLHNRGKAPAADRCAELVAAAKLMPLTVLQGERDAMGTPLEVAAALADGGARGAVLSVPLSDHSFQTPAKANVTSDEVAMVLVEGARMALLHRTGNGGPLLPR